ncbi:MAG: beta family protein [Desulfovibrionaceae bacterium]
MFDYKHYVPVLKLKAGELRALMNLTEDQRKVMTPLFEIPPVPWDYETDEPAKSVEEHLEKVAGNIDKHWGKAPFFLDYKYIEDDIVEHDNEAIWRLSGAMNDLNLSYVPVIGLIRDGVIKHEFKDSQCYYDNGLCVRLEGDDFDSDDYGEQLVDLIESFEVEPDRVDIVIDLGLIPSSGLSPFVVGLKNIIRFLPMLNEWRTLTVSASSFPSSLASFTANAADTTPRSDWELWGRLVGGAIRRKPSFGDYGIASPAPFEMDPRMMRLGAKIKYTLEEKWLIVKGVGISRKGYKQFHDLAAYLTKRKEFYGPEFSWGDNYINECATRACNSGNQTTWVTVGMNHHFAVAVSQLSDLDDA